jgi:hypothetical protein
MRWGPYISTDTGAPQVSAGRLVVVSQAMSLVTHACLTSLGSIEGAGDFGAGIGDVEHCGSDSDLQDVARRVDTALGLIPTTILYSYDREVSWNIDGYPQIEIAFGSPSGAETLTTRLGR